VPLHCLVGQGGFHLVVLILTELKDHMSCYEFECSLLVENLFVKIILKKICSPIWMLFQPMRGEEFHVIFKHCYNQIYQLKTIQVIYRSFLSKMWNHTKVDEQVPLKMAVGIWFTVTLIVLIFVESLCFWAFPPLENQKKSVSEALCCKVSYIFFLKVSKSYY
jgi:hypothetical protein